MINKLQGCFFASGDLQASRVSKHIFCSSWCIMFHPSPFSLRQSFRSRSRFWNPDKLQRQSHSRRRNLVAELWLREIRTVPKIFWQVPIQKWWKGAGIPPFFSGKTRIFQKKEKFLLFGWRWLKMQPNNHQSNLHHPERVWGTWISQRLFFSGRPSCWSEIEVIRVVLSLYESRICCCGCGFASDTSESDSSM